MEYIIDIDKGKVFREVNGIEKEIGKWQKHGNIIVYVEGKPHILPRLIFEAAYGEIPDGYMIGHRNGDPFDNRITNLYCYQRKKKVQQLSLTGEVIKEYDSISDVTKDGYTISNVSRCCRGLHKQHKGYIWKFI